MCATRHACKDEEAPDEREDRCDRVALVVLCTEHFPMTVDEIGRELGDHGDAADGVARLARAGLVHRFGEFVFPTYAARRADEIGAGSL